MLSGEYLGRSDPPTVARSTHAPFSWVGAQYGGFVNNLRANPDGSDVCDCTAQLLMLRMRAAFERAEHHSTVVAEFLPQSDLAGVISSDRHRLDRVEERDAGRVVGRRGAFRGQRRQHTGELR